MQPTLEEYNAQMKQQGRDWLHGRVNVGSFGGIKLNDKQKEFINSKERSILISGGMASGKSLAFIIKLILLSQWFPGCKILVGRKTKENAEETFMKDFAEICPREMYTHSKGYHRITFTNGSLVEFWGLDALQSGASSDIKKAEQNLRSHNFTFEFIDQLEEIESKVYDALQPRMRHKFCKHGRDSQTIYYNKKKEPIFEVCSICGEYTFNQFSATTNPANFWGYDYFKKNPRPNTKLIETSMFDNKDHLSEQFIQEQLQKPKLWVQKFVYGEWSPDSLTEGAVFSEEYIKQQDLLAKSPIRTINGIRIYEEPRREKYQIGIDPSLGATDPCNITCVSMNSGRVVATFTAMVPTQVIVERAVQIAMLYSQVDHPLIVPEATGVGQALVESLKKVYDSIYIREVYNTKALEKKTSKLGFYTTHSSKTQLIENLKELFQKGLVYIYDQDTIEELKTFIYNDSAREKGAGAQQGYHDDRVMGLLLAYWKVIPSPLPEMNTDNEEFLLYSVRYK